MGLQFDVRDYEAQFAEGRRLYDVVARLEQPERVPVRISVGGSFFAKLFGCNLRDYYTNLDLRVEVQVRGLKWVLEYLRDDRTGVALTVDPGPVQEALYWGLPIEYADDTSPWIVPQLHTPEDIERLEVPDPEECEGVRWVYGLYEEMRAKVAKMGLNVPVSGGLSIHPPLSAACALMPADEVYAYMAEEPTLIHRFFAKLLAGWLKLREYQDRYFGKRTEDVSLADDHSAFISNAMYRRMLLPYNLTIYERYGKRGRHLHADGPNDHHFQMYATVHRLTSMDIGGFSDIANAKPSLFGHTLISGGVNCRDLYYDFATAKPAVDRALRLGAPGGGYVFAVGGETYAGVNPDTLVQVVSYVKRAGRYPLDLKALGADEETRRVLAAIGLRETRQVADAD